MRESLSYPFPSVRAESARMKTVKVKSVRVKSIGVKSIKVKQVQELGFAWLCDIVLDSTISLVFFATLLQLVDVLLFYHLTSFPFTKLGRGTLLSIPLRPSITASLNIRPRNLHSSTSFTLPLDLLSWCLPCLAKCVYLPRVLKSRTLI